YSDPLTVRKAGPPESPWHGCDGALVSVNVVASTVATVEVPRRLRPLSVAAPPVVPNPAMRTVAPTRVASGVGASTATGVAGAGAASMRSATSMVKVAATYDG